MVYLLASYSKTRKCSRRKRTSSAVGMAVARSSALGEVSFARESQNDSSMLEPVVFSDQSWPRRSSLLSYSPTPFAYSEKFKLTN